MSVGTGRKGTYHWGIKDGLHAAYHYPHGVKTPVVLVLPQSSARRAYQACVDHNKAGSSNRATTSGPILSSGVRPVLCAAKRAQNVLTGRSLARMFGPKNAPSSENARISVEPPVRIELV